jgi:hypothetical protein
MTAATRPRSASRLPVPPLYRLPAPRSGRQRCVDSARQGWASTLRYTPLPRRAGACARAELPARAVENSIGDAAIVAAGARLTARGASPLVASDDSVGTTTRTALDKPAQQAFGASLAFRSQADRVAEPCRGRRPALLVNDGQLRSHQIPAADSRVSSVAPPVPCEHRYTRTQRCRTWAIRLLKLMTCRLKISCEDGASAV